MDQAPAVLIVVPHVSSGGAARVALSVAAGLAAQSYSVHLAALAQVEPHPPLPPHVHFHTFGTRRVRGSALPLLRLVRTLRPHAVLSTMIHANLLVLALRPLFPRGTRVLVRHNAVLAHSQHLRLVRHLYRRADAVICQSSAMAIDFRRLLGGFPRLHVLPNPTDLTRLRAPATSASSPFTARGPRLLAIGRLAPEKGFDLLLEAFAAILPHHPAAELCIVGDGPQKAGLQALAYALTLHHHVRFEGHVSDPEPWLYHADLFVLPSRHDAVPNVLLEAAAAGLPLVATPASGAVPSLLEDDPGAWLAREVSAGALADALLAALPPAPSSRRFAHPWIEAFDATRVLAQYDELIRRTIAGVPA